MKVKKTTLITLTLLLFGSLYLGTSISHTSAQGTLSTDVKAGNTYYYNVSKFPTFTQLMDLTGASDNFNSTDYLHINGGLAGSQIYAKVMNTGTDHMSYWDGTSLIDGNVPTVDVSAGLITGQVLNVEASTAGNVVNTDVPAGIGLPIPVIFGSASMFNVSNIETGNILPFPLVLSNNYNLHQTILTQASQQVNGAIQVTNDNSQFKGTFVDVVVDSTSHVMVNGYISYNKPSGLLQEVNIQMTNSSTSQTLFDIDIDLAQTVYHGLDVSVGDTFSLKVSDAGFDYSTSSSDANVKSQLDQILSWVDGNMTNQIGNEILQFKVVEVRGLYYSIEGTVTDGNGGTQAFPAKDGVFNDFWMSGFARFGPGMPIPTSDPAKTFHFADVYNTTSGYYDYIQTSQLEPLRNRAFPGPFATADFGIFHAWDKTLTYVVSLFNGELQTGIQALEDVQGQIQFSSSTTADPIVTVAFNSDSSANHYAGWELSTNWDVSVWGNSTGNDTVPSYTEVSTTGNLALAVDYNNTVLQDISLNGGFDFNVTQYNSSTTQYVTGSVSNLVFKLSVTTSVTPYVPPTPTSSTNTTVSSGGSSTSSGGLGLPLPGFEFVGALLAVISIGTFVNLKKKRLQV